MYLFIEVCFFSYAGYTSDDLKAFLCQSDWWDHSFTICEYKLLCISYTFNIFGE